MTHASSTTPSSTITGPLGFMDILCRRLQLIHVFATGSTTTRYACRKVTTTLLKAATQQSGDEFGT